MQANNAAMLESMKTLLMESLNPIQGVLQGLDTRLTAIERGASTLQTQVDWLHQSVVLQEGPGS